MHPTPNDQSTSNDAYWFVLYPGYLQAWSHSWSVVQDYWYWLIGQNPGGTQEGSFSYDNGHNRAPAFTPNSVVTGDVLFYDWGTGLGISHVSMQVGSGTDQYGYYGNWVGRSYQWSQTHFLDVEGFTRQHQLDDYYCLVHAYMG